MTTRRSHSEAADADDEAVPQPTANVGDDGKGALAAKIRVEQEQGYVGITTETKPNSAFTVAGVTGRE